jgi:sugar-phosphatase
MEDAIMNHGNYTPGHSIWETDDKTIKAVIFGMDGVVIDTNGFWADAEREVFGAVGVEVTPELANQTAGMSTAQVTEFWFERSLWNHPSKAEVEQRVVECVGASIGTRGQAMDGFLDLFAGIQKAGLKAGLETNSPRSLVEKVIHRLGIEGAFDAVLTFDDVDHPKPAPEVYLKCLEALDVLPSDTVIIEDSTSGVEAGCEVFHFCSDADLGGCTKSRGIYVRNCVCFYWFFQCY